ncbi:MAG TPA: 50S ribosomal protein L25 [Candidatus Hydrogenedentes bacterium]|nr:50S ribosomal protein L25 [Candidatus Hydrogenedentota bacterium]
MQLVTLNAEVRETGRKTFTSRTRAADRIPAVVYGNAADAVAVAVDRKIIEKLLHTEGGIHAVVQLEFDNAPEYNSPALIKATQRDPIRDALLHVDFLRIRLDQRIQTEVAVVLTGRAKGVVEGGIIDHQIREVDIECLALDAPQHLEVDISHLGMGESVHVSDLKVAEGVTILTDANLAIASVHAPRVLKTAEEEAAEAAEAAEAEAAAEAEKEEDNE